MAVTAHRRAAEQSGAFERHGARVIHAPALKLAPVDQDDAVLAAVRETIATPPDAVLVTTGYGFDRWLRVAEQEGLGDDAIAMVGADRFLDLTAPYRDPDTGAFIPGTAGADNGHPNAATQLLVAQTYKNELAALFQEVWA